MVLKEVLFLSITTNCMVTRKRKKCQEKGSWEENGFGNHVSRCQREIVSERKSLQNTARMGLYQSARK